MGKQENNTRIRKEGIRTMKNEKMLNDKLPSWYKMIDKSSINRIMLHREEGFIIVSPMRIGTDNCDSSKELKETKALEDEIVENQFSFTPVFEDYKEGYPAVESSFIIYARKKAGEIVPFDELYKFGLSMCRKYKQDSFYIQEPDHNGEHAAAYYVNSDGQKENPDQTNDSIFENKFTIKEFGNITTRRYCIEHLGMILV